MRYLIWIIALSAFITGAAFMGWASSAGALFSAFNANVLGGMPIEGQIIFYGFMLGLAVWSLKSFLS